MNKIVVLTITSLLLCISAQAQYAYFGNRGTISFDKVVYTRAQTREMMKKFDDMSTNGMGGGRHFWGGDINTMPDSRTERMTMHFDEYGSLLVPEINDEENKDSRNQPRISGGRAGRGGGSMGAVTMRGGGGAMAMRSARTRGGSSKVLYQNLKSNTAEVQVELDDKYILKDSLTEVTWRFTDEYRNIAGFECRRVNGATADSLYLVAFYTDQIPVSAGPALSHGLPGMILGLAIPEMHIQYWATKVDYHNDTVPTDWRDKKSKAMTLDDFSNSIGRFFQRGDDSGSAKKRILEQIIY
ncbi:GLPGLI family protein [Sphingobacterium faecale]|uniref:GLPGLI family protein n=1 Tax=Sphingobacterium faecale TaxID=2803775 RepID=A0ABS1R7I3_9SPHI|nr:GLPGLI family protein [Sphingobacterium faecale]MBL1410659.1 GLPGLI family protein [Sphingobacterium faecale]